ncbi:DUF397 domain-containing protein [Micromonospora lupini]|uniref:DUF397 domain-containing protein n=1 Tax=Micromonospora lupini TaxID=285679 RepID=UPI0022596458|nr:DUF397 domain-containing protein [Micromonospora lupini]MCX5066174.1 DUF397 domain-containing protein [Micromonospora lupini]
MGGAPDRRAAPGAPARLGYDVRHATRKRSFADKAVDVATLDRRWERIRDGDPAGPALTFAPAAWTRFLVLAKRG